MTQKRRIAVTKNVVKSRHTILLLRSPGGEIGRRKGLLIRCFIRLQLGRVVACDKYESDRSELITAKPLLSA